MKSSANASRPHSATEGDTVPAVSFGEALATWVRVAILSFGGPAAQISVMHRLLVEEKGWISDARFMHALNYCMLLPGPEAMQLATYIGWLLHRTAGGLIAGTLFVLPGFVSILLLSVLYAGFADLPVVQALFFGIKAAVLAVVAQAMVRIGRRVLKNGWMVAIAGASFVAIFVLGVPFPYIIIAAALAGLAGGHWLHDRFTVITPAGDPDGDPDGGPEMESARPHHGRAFRVAATWLALWFVPLGAMMAVLGPDHVFSQIGWFFSKLAVLTFGGAYAVLAWMAQATVESYGWLAPGEMLDGLGMAESTPGPLIQVVQFVAFMGAFREPGVLSPMAAGIVGSVIATWMTFVPCFLWIFLGAPYVERLRNRARLNAALSAITAAVVGVVANLALWFGLHVLFGEVGKWRTGPVTLLVPNPATLDPASALLTLAALVALIRFRAGMLPVIGISAALGAAWYLATG
ncbi:MAG: chromate efflux transporter [Wenzhouxiangellaceae bacterium]|nr:chromate efflux transporter [Wenzhouxiangellaceae bacterium]